MPLGESRPWTSCQLISGLIHSFSLMVTVTSTNVDCGRNLKYTESPHVAPGEHANSTEKVS